MSSTLFETYFKLLAKQVHINNEKNFDPGSIVIGTIQEHLISYSSQTASTGPHIPG